MKERIVPGKVDRIRAKLYNKYTRVETNPRQTSPFFLCRGNLRWVKHYSHAGTTDNLLWMSYYIQYGWKALCARKENRGNRA